LCCTYVVGGIDEVWVLIDEEFDHCDVTVQYGDVQQSSPGLVTGYTHTVHFIGFVLLLFAGGDTARPGGTGVFC